MSLKGKIQFAEITHTGKVRDHNEEAIGTNDEMEVFLEQIGDLTVGI